MVPIASNGFVPAQTQTGLSRRACSLLAPRLLQSKTCRSMRGHRHLNDAGQRIETEAEHSRKEGNKRTHKCACAPVCSQVRPTEFACWCCPMVETFGRLFVLGWTMFLVRVQQKERKKKKKLKSTLPPAKRDVEKTRICRLACLFCCISRNTGRVTLTHHGRPKDMTRQMQVHKYSPCIEIHWYK